MFFLASRRPGVQRCAPAVLESLENRTLLANSIWAFPDSNGRLVYGTQPNGDQIPDFSMVGYKTGNVPLPNTAGGVSVPVKITLNPGAAGVDMTSTIQNAINSVSSMPLDANGFRGAVKLNAGNYPISGTLNINASGVVLMGVGDSSTTGTRLEATGTATRFLISVSGSGSRSSSGTTYNITDSYVPVGARSFHVDSLSSLSVGDNILITRPSPQNWIDDIGMNLLDNPWQPGSKNQNWERTVTAIDSATKTVTIDIPLTNSLDSQYDGGSFRHYTYSGRINQSGISDVYLYSDSTGAGDLAHATGSITMDKIVNGWIHNITSDGFAVNQVIFSGGAKFCTLDDAIVQNTTVSSQAPPAGVSINGQLNLVENVVEHGVYHAVALGATVPGPNVVVNLFADGIGSDCGPHQRWSTGGLFDDVTIVGNDLQAYNRGNSGTGHGWAGANYVFWNSSARNLEIDNPPTAQNWAIGCIGNKSSNGTFESLGTNVSPQSLYAKQLWDRTHVNPTVATAASASPNPLNGATSINLSVLGADASVGESGLTYTWTCTSKPGGASNPVFGANGTNAARNTSASLSTLGTYIFTVTIQDAGGLKTTSTVIVTPQPAVVISGDQDFANENDTIRIVRNGSFLDVYRNSAVPFIHQDYSTAPQFIVNSLGGNDTIVVDYSGGNPIPINGLVVDAGDGNLDAVSVVGASGNDTVSLVGASISINGEQFGFSNAEQLDLQLGAGNDTLSVAGNGGVSVTSTRLSVTGGGSLAMSASSTLPDFTDLNVSGATFNLNAQSQTINSLNGNGTIVNNGGAAATLTVGQYNGDGSFSGSIADGTASLALTKAGSGTLVLGGNNSFSGITRINGGIVESASSASLVGLSGPIWFNGGTLHVTADSVAANVANKFSTTYSGANSSSTATLDIDAGATLTVGGSAGASMRTNGGGSHGGAFTKTGSGTLRILSNNGQLDDPFKLKQGTVIIESATALGGADNSNNHLDMSSGTTLVMRQNASTNFLTPINIVDPGAAVNVVIDRTSSGAGVTHSLNALSSVGAFTLNLDAGVNIASGVAGLTLGAVTLGGSGTFNIVGPNVLLNVPGAVSGGFGLVKIGSGGLTLAGVNSYTGTTVVTAGNLRVDGSIAASGGVIVAPGASFIAGSTQSLAFLTINSGGSASVVAGADKVLSVSSLSILGSGTLDLADNDLIVDYGGTSPLSTVKGWIASGFAGGAWNGSGIISSTAASNPLAGFALGYAEASDLGLSSFDGQNLDGSAVLVKFTYAGDANLDGQVDVTDLGRLASGWQTTQDWIGGDFNYDGLVDVSDLGILATNWQKGVGAPLAPVFSSVSVATVATAAPAASTPHRTTTARANIHARIVEI